MGRVVFGGPERTGVVELSAGFGFVHALMTLAMTITTESVISFDKSINFESVWCAETVKAKHSTLRCILGHSRSLGMRYDTRAATMLITLF